MQRRSPIGVFSRWKATADQIHLVSEIISKTYQDHGVDGQTSAFHRWQPVQTSVGLGSRRKKEDLNMLTLGKMSAERKPMRAERKPMSANLRESVNWMFNTPATVLLNQWKDALSSTDIFASFSSSWLNSTDVEQVLTIKFYSFQNHSIACLERVKIHRLSGESESDEQERGHEIWVGI
jgi:hypothetical protein